MIYYNVAAPSPYEAGHADRRLRGNNAIKIVLPSGRDIPEYLVSGNTAYLPVAHACRVCNAADEIQLRAVSTDNVTELLESNPSIRTFFPEPQAPDGGVKWLLLPDTFSIGETETASKQYGV